MSGIVIFDPDEFKEIYPEFKDVPNARLAEFFTEATLLVDNTINSPIADLAVRKTLLYLMVAHLAYLLFGKDGTPGPVGRISHATEGSVSVSLDMPGTNANSAWYMQTPYGAKYWAVTAPWRTAHYVPGGSPSLYPPRYYRRYGRGWWGYGG